MIYLPPNGTLRGGAWVVVDSTINKQQIEMYAGRPLRTPIDLLFLLLRGFIVHFRATGLALRQ